MFTLTKVILKVCVTVIFSLIFTAVLINIFFIISGFRMRPHSGVYFNKERTESGDFSNFIVPDFLELFSNSKNASFVPEYWETDMYGFRFNPTHTSNSNNFSPVLIIGDSFAYGHGVKHTQSWPYILERKICQNEFKCRIYNAAVPASSTDQQYIRFKNISAWLKPKVTIWTMSVNDMADSNSQCLFLPKSDQSYVQIPAVLNIGYINATLTRILPNWFVKTPLGNLITTTTIQGKDLYTFGCTKMVSEENNTQVLLDDYLRKVHFFVKESQKYAISQHMKLIFLISPYQIFFDQNYPNEDKYIQLLSRMHQVIQDTGVESINMNYEFARRYSPHLYASRKIELAEISSRILGTLTTEIKDVSVHDDFYLDEGKHFNYGDWHLNEIGNLHFVEILHEYLTDKLTL